MFLISCAATPKVWPVLPLWRLLVNQTQVGLVHQRRALQGVIDTLAPQLAMRDAAQLLIHDEGISASRAPTSP